MKVSVSAPASSANLGPGFDVLGAALGVGLRLTVSESGKFGITNHGQPTRANRSNLCVEAFEALHSSERFHFDIDVGMPATCGLGSSAAAIVAGLLAANTVVGGPYTRPDIYREAVRIEGHPDNVAASLYGGFVICPKPKLDDTPLPEPITLGVPAGLSAVLVVPKTELKTRDARAVLPADVPLADVVRNLGAISQLILGLARADLALVAAGLVDSVHQSRRANLYPRSLDLVSQAANLGALGATISGAGPSVLLWTTEQESERVARAAAHACDGWARVLPVPFKCEGAEVLDYVV